MSRSRYGFLPEPSFFRLFGSPLVIEHGEWQGAGIRQLLTEDGWRGVATHPDLTRRDRATTALRP